LHRLSSLYPSLKILLCLGTNDLLISSDMQGSCDFPSHEMLDRRQECTCDNNHTSESDTSKENGPIRRRIGVGPLIELSHLCFKLSRLSRVSKQKRIFENSSCNSCNKPYNRSAWIRLTGCSKHPFHCPQLKLLTHQILRSPFS